MVLFAYGLDVEDAEQGDSLGAISRYSFPILVFIATLVIAATMNKNNPSFGLWHFISYVQLVRWLPLIDAELPLFLNHFFAGVARGLDDQEILPTDAGEPLGGQFEHQGIETNLFLSNAEECMLIWLAVLLVYLGIVLAAKFSKSPFLVNAHRKVKYSLVLRATLVLYLDFAVFSIVQLKGLSFSSMFAGFSSLLGMTVFVLCAGFLFIVPISMKIGFDRFELSKDKQLVVQLATLSEEFSVSEYERYQYYTLYVSLRFILAASLVLLNNASAQLIIAGLCQLLILVYIGTVRPYKRRGETALMFLSELCILLIVAGMGGFYTGQLSEPVQVWLCIGLVAIVWTGEGFCICRFLLLTQNVSSVIPKPIQRRIKAAPETTMEIDTFRARKPRRITKVKAKPAKKKTELTEQEKVDFGLMIRPEPPPRPSLLQRIKHKWKTFREARRIEPIPEEPADKTVDQSNMRNESKPVVHEHPSVAAAKNIIEKYKKTQVGIGNQAFPPKPPQAPRAIRRSVAARGEPNTDFDRLKFELFEKIDKFINK